MKPVRLFSFVLSFAFLFALCALLPAASWAQMAGTGHIDGVVTDPSGAAVPAATATLTDTTTHASRTATTNDAGRYVFSDVVPGTYDLAITKDGFSVIKFSNQ